ncbi:MAG: NAD-dependent epimerase/dehydratase family protein [Deltaproteobacteria bacterium]|nr:NAD-dependent epimerase/dehydratase family protein [Deltaproteobacteria bacterium]
MDLLTGATGYLGRHLAARLAARGRSLRALVRVGTDLKRIPKEISEVVWGGLDDPKALARATHGIDTIYHVAARVSTGGSRAEFERDNVTCTENLLEAAEASGVRRLVYVSSAGIYGSDAAAAEIREDTPLDPAIEQRGAYAWSKARADERVRRFAESSKLDVIVIRPGILYGAEAKPFLGRLSFPVPRGRGRRIVVGSRKALLPLTHVDNACEAIALAGERGRRGAAYNVIDGAVTQDDYFAQLASSGASAMRPTYLSSAFFYPVALGCEVASRLARRSLPLTRYKLRRATESLRYDTRAAREDLGWAPALDLEAGVATLARQTGRSSEQRGAPG